MPDDPTHLFIFDIDGTLLLMDEETAYARAIKERTGLEITVDWELYKSNTDWGVAHEILTGHLGRDPSDDEVQEALDLFIRLLLEGIEDGTTPPTVADGAIDFVRQVAEEGHAMALATGCVRASAKAKVGAIGLDDVLDRGGFGDKRFQREALLRDAIQAAQVQHGRKFSARETVYFGDKRWDCHAARDMGIHFVGVAMTNEAERKLRDAGAPFVIRSYTEIGEPLDVFADGTRP